MSAMRRFSLALLAAAASAPLYAQTANTPAVKEGDKWVYNVKTEQVQNGVLGASERKWEAWILRVGSHSMVMANKATDANLPPHEGDVNLDWSSTRIIGGQEKLTARPYAFPLTQGKSWDTDATFPHPAPGQASLRNTLHYTVLGWEQVTVPAGTFKALKIEAEGSWVREFEPQGPATNGAVHADQNGQVATITTQPARTREPIGGKIYKLTWYAPEVKRDVKMISEDYDSSGSVQRRTTEELASWTVH